MDPQAQQANEVAAQIALWRTEILAIHRVTNDRILQLETTFSEQQKSDNTRLQMLETAFAEHMTICNDQKDQIGELIRLIQDIKATGRAARGLRSVVVWISSVGTSCAALYYAFKAK